MYCKYKFKAALLNKSTRRRIEQIYSLICLFLYFECRCTSGIPAAWIPLSPQPPILSRDLGLWSLKANGISIHQVVSSEIYLYELNTNSRKLYPPPAAQLNFQ